MRSPRWPKALTVEDQTQIKVASLAASVAPAIKKEQTQIKAVPKVNDTARWPVWLVPEGPALQLVQEAQMAKVSIPAWRAV